MKPLPLQSPDRIIKILELIRAHSQSMPRPAASSLIAQFGKDPYLILISCILSLRAKDTTSFPASCELFTYARTPEQMVALPQDQLEKIIYKTGFYRQKARTIKQLSEQLVTRFNSKVPNTYHELISLKGIGPKTANLVLGYAFDIPAICVDTHVHKLANRLGFVRTKTVEETQVALEAVVPKDYWIDLNDILVIWGQNICLPVSPLCSQCIVRSDCPRVGVARSR